MTSQVPSPATRALLAERSRAYEAQLWEPEAEEALIYLASRGLTNDVVVDFRVGYVNEPLVGDDRYQGRLSIPYITPSGVVGMKFRSVGDSPKRWAKDPGEPNRLFNTRALINTGLTVITEGEMDCISAAQCGFDAVGVPGANNWLPEWNRVFAQRDVVVIAQGDDPSREFAEKAAVNIERCKIVVMPEDEDVNSMLQSEGVDWIRKKVLG